MTVEQSTLEKKARALLEERGVPVIEIAKLVYFLQEKYIP
ncbi:MAG: phosphatidylglycerophosphatase A, partial [Enterococcus italicus]